MKIFLIIILISFTSTLTAQEINLGLKMRLDSIYYKDQVLRKISQPETSKEKKHQILKEFGYSEEEFAKDKWKIISLNDSLNLIDIKEIIENYGYPGNTLVGKPTNKSAWFVIQHSNEIEKYFPIIKNAGKNNEIPLTLVAMMEDRMLMFKGLEQIYDTQGNRSWNINKQTEKKEYVMFIWPIKEPEKVNELRKAIGFTTTIEEYSKLLGINYKIYSLEDINKPNEK